jgi:hypothetical protein
MEEDLREYNDKEKSLYHLNKLAQERLTDAAKAAEERIKYDAAHNPELLRSLAIVANFIRRKGRVCYGGTAMNEILPDSQKFYDPEVDLPDYDFFTPSLEEDTDDLVAELQKAGFKDVYKKMGIHEGTIKILVNFSPVADITRIEKGVFETLAKRAINKHGILYTDPDCLRSMMYLELSRPRGMVSRWEKVFERLELINEQFPVKGCPGGSWPISKVPASTVKQIYEFILEENRILCSGPLESIFARGMQKGDAKLKAAAGGPVIFLTPDIRADAKALVGRMTDTSLFLHKEKGGFIPERMEIRVKGKPVAIAVADSACHAYYSVPVENDGRVMLVASHEMVISLYLSLAIFTKQHRNHFDGNPFCRVRKLIQLARKNYVAKSSQFTPFSINCKGYQKGFPSLLREKLLRILREKAQGTRKKASKAKTTRKTIH